MFGDRTSEDAHTTVLLNDWPIIRAYIISRKCTQMIFLGSIFKAAFGKLGTLIL